MAITARRNPTALVFALAEAFNLYVRAQVDGETTYPHYDVTSTPGGGYTAPTSSALVVVSSSTADLAHVITMAEEIRSVLLVHFADDVAHKGADADNLALISYDAIAALTSSSSQGATDTLLNALSTALTAHEADEDGVHAHADTTNAITAPSATNLATSKALAADVKAQTNAHVRLAWPSPSLNIISA